MAPIIIGIQAEITQMGMKNFINKNKNKLHRRNMIYIVNL